MSDRSRPRGVRRMALAGVALVAFAATGSAAINVVDAAPAHAAAKPAGIDVSGWQGDVDWKQWWGKGKRFAMVKATQATNYKNPHFAQQYNGSYKVGMIRGAYHFAEPNKSSGKAQAEYFVRNGGGWTGDGKTLPGALDIEYNPYGEVCFGMRGAAMVRWIKDFTSTYKKLTGRDAIIYTAKNWWDPCTGSSKAFGDTNPLWVARYAKAPGDLPAGWKSHTFWQFTSEPLDQNEFNGSMDRLKVLARGSDTPKPTSKPTESPKPTTKPTGKPSESPKPTEPPASSEAPKPSESPGGGGGDDELPLTGPQALLAGGVGLALMITGVVLLVAARRRKLTIPGIGTRTY